MSVRPLAPVVSLRSEVLDRPSREVSLVGLDSVTILNSEGFDVTVFRPSRAYFRKDGLVTIRSHSKGSKTVTTNKHFFRQAIQDGRITILSVDRSF